MSIARLLKQQIIIEAADGEDGFGTMVFASPVSYPARVVSDIRELRSPQGNQTTSMVTIFLEGNVSVTPNDRITLPDGFVPQQPPILGIEKQPGRTGEIVFTAILC